jgi:hypothetical protein
MLIPFLFIAHQPHLERWEKTNSNSPPFKVGFNAGHNVAQILPLTYISPLTELIV